MERRIGDRGITRGAFAMWSLHACNICALLLWGFVIVAFPTSSVPLIRDARWLFVALALALPAVRLAGWRWGRETLYEQSQVGAVAFWLFLALLYAWAGSWLVAAFQMVFAGIAFAGFGLDSRDVILIDETPPPLEMEWKEYLTPLTLSGLGLGLFTMLTRFGPAILSKLWNAALEWLQPSQRAAVIEAQLKLDGAVWARANEMVDAYRVEVQALRGEVKQLRTLIEERDREHQREIDDLRQSYEIQLGTERDKRHALELKVEEQQEEIGTLRAKVARLEAENEQQRQRLEEARLSGNSREDG